MDVNDVFRTVNFAVEAGYTVLAKFDDGEQPTLREARYFFSGACYLGHVNDVCRTNDVTYSAAGASLKINGFDHPWCAHPSFQPR